MPRFFRLSDFFQRLSENFVNHLNGDLGLNIQHHPGGNVGRGVGWVLGRGKSHNGVGVPNLTYLLVLCGCLSTLYSSM